MGFVGRIQETGLSWETSLQESTGKMKLGSPAQLSHGSSYPYSFFFFFFFNLLLIYKFIYFIYLFFGCVGSSLMGTGFL